MQYTGCDTEGNNVTSILQRHWLKFFDIIRTILIQKLIHIQFGINLKQFYINFSIQEHQIDRSTAEILELVGIQSPLYSCIFISRVLYISKLMCISVYMEYCVYLYTCIYLEYCVYLYTCIYLEFFTYLYTRSPVYICKSGVL